METLYQILAGYDFLEYEIDENGMIELLELYDDNLIDKFKEQPLTFGQYVAVCWMVQAFFYDNDERVRLMRLLKNLANTERELTTEVV